MKRRARRITFGVAALGAAVIAVLGVPYRDAVRDHAEAWRFQLTRETKAFEPLGLEPTPPDGGDVLFGPAPAFQILSTYSNRRVVFDPAEHDDGVLWSVHRDSTLTADAVLQSLRGSGWRVLEQVFPRRAYIVIRAADPPGESPPQGLLWDGLDLPVPEFAR